MLIQVDYGQSQTLKLEKYINVCMFYFSLQMLKRQNNPPSSWTTVLSCENKTERSYYKCIYSYISMVHDMQHKLEVKKLDIINNNVLIVNTT